MKKLAKLKEDIVITEENTIKDSLSKVDGENTYEAENRREKRWVIFLSQILRFNHKFARLEQNRKSAKKCRLKKKAEYSQMSVGVDHLHKENRELKEKVSGQISINGIWLDQQHDIDAVLKDWGE